MQYETKEDQEDIITITFLLMARAGVRALEFYDPATKKHGQAHMRQSLLLIPWRFQADNFSTEARMGITNALVRDGIAILTEKRDESGKLVDAYIRVDREKVLSQGRECMSKLLKELQVRKCIADGEGARKFYSASGFCCLSPPPLPFSPLHAEKATDGSLSTHAADLTNPLPGWDTELRDLVIAKKAVRLPPSLSSSRLSFSSLPKLTNLCPLITASEALRPAQHFRQGRRFGRAPRLPAHARGCTPELR